MLPQPLSPLLPLIDANEILMMQRQPACGSSASLGGGGRREGGREGGWEGGARQQGLDTSSSITASHSFLALPNHRGSLGQGLSSLGLLCL